jgi:hypothetical protein
MQPKQSISTVGLGAASGGLSGALWGIPHRASVPQSSGRLGGRWSRRRWCGGALGVARRLRHRRQLHPLRWRKPAARDIGPVRAPPQGATGEGSVRAVALPRPRLKKLLVAGAGGTAPGRALRTGSIPQERRCVAGRARPLGFPGGLTSSRSDGSSPTKVHGGACEARSRGHQHHGHVARVRITWPRPGDRTSQGDNQARW